VSHSYISVFTWKFNVLEGPVAFIFYTNWKSHMYRRVTLFINNDSLYTAETVQVHTYVRTHTTHWPKDMTTFFCTILCIQ